MLRSTPRTCRDFFHVPNLHLITLAGFLGPIKKKWLISWIIPRKNDFDFLSDFLKKTRALYRMFYDFLSFMIFGANSHTIHPYYIYLHLPYKFMFFFNVGIPWSHGPGMGIGDPFLLRKWPPVGWPDLLALVYGHVPGPGVDAFGRLMDGNLEDGFWGVSA